MKAGCRLLLRAGTYPSAASIPRQAIPFSSARSNNVSSIRHTSSGTGSKSRNRGRRVLLPALAVSVISVYTYDHFVQANALQRSLFTLYTGISIALDYKFNFKPSKSESIDALHQRVADRLHKLCVTNQGLYIKLGQALGMQAAVLPAPYRVAFANIFDAAPPITYDQVKQVFQDEFGQDPHQVFDEFEEKPIASASIAQVHRARLKRSGQLVAVKVQRPEIVKQMEWDLFSYKALMYCYDYLFEIPCSWMADYIASRMRLETKFTIEASNAERTSKNIAGEASLRHRVSVPTVHWDKTTDRIMTADFVEGACRLNDREKIRSWGLKEKDVMQAATDCFAAMVFKFGLVHCDPHYGNVLVRPHPNNKSKPEVVIIDHGLYVELTDEFRRDYSLLWKSLFVMDTPTIERIASGWGFGSPDMFASATLLRPFRTRKQKRPASDSPGAPGSFEAQISVKEKLKNMLQNEKLIPRELVFLTRCMRMMQANNQTLGSPVNRINILAHWAVDGLADTSRSTQQATHPAGIRAWLHDQYNVWVFRSFLLIIDAGFLLTKARQAILALFGYKHEGFEDLLQKQITAMARDDLGVELDDAAFEG